MALQCKNPFETQINQISDPAVTALIGWQFSSTLDDVDSDMLVACGPQIQFLKVFRKNWRPGTSKFRFPEEWQVHPLPV